MTNYEAVVFDIDGVLYRGTEAVPGAREALGRVQNAGLRIVFATNNSTRAAADVAATIEDRIGFPARSDQVVSSAMATARHLEGRFQRAYVIGGAGLVATLAAAGIGAVDGWRDAEVVVVGLDTTLTYDKLADATLAVRDGGAHLVATNDDATFPSRRGLLPGGGAIVAAIERATSVQAEVCGKPHEPMRRVLRSVTGTGSVVVIGDRIDTDMALGWSEGWMTVLTLTGVTTAVEAADVDVDHVVTSVAELPALLGL